MKTKLDGQCEKTYEENIEINNKLDVAVYSMTKKMEDKLEIEIIEDEEKKRYDIRTFLM